MTLNSIGTVSGTSSQAVNLVSYALTFDSFKDKDFVIVNDSDYSYYIVWGNLNRDGNKVVSTGKVEYIRYYRVSSSSYNNYYTYVVGEDSSFTLNLSSENIVTTNMDGVGFVSNTYVQHDFYYDTGIMFVLALSMIFAMMIKAFRRSSL